MTDVNDTDAQVDAVLEDPNLDREQKIVRLREIYLDARALQRAATESPMGEDGAEADRSAAKIRKAEAALARLGVDPLTFDDDNAATL